MHFWENLSGMELTYCMIFVMVITWVFTILKAPG